MKEVLLSLETLGYLIYCVTIFRHLLMLGEAEEEGASG